MPLRILYGHQSLSSTVIQAATVLILPNVVQIMFNTRIYLNCTAWLVKDDDADIGWL